MILELAARVVKLLAPLALKGAADLGKKIGGAAVDKITGLLTDLKSRWENDSDAKETLERFEEDPENTASELEETLARKMTEDATFAEAVDQTIQDIGPKLSIEIEGGEIKVVEGPEVGKIKGKADVSYKVKVDKSDRVDGGKYDEIG
jgi:hypothetical protein